MRLRHKKKTLRAGAQSTTVAKLGEVGTHSSEDPQDIRIGVRGIGGLFTSGKVGLKGVGANPDPTSIVIISQKKKKKGEKGIKVR